MTKSKDYQEKIIRRRTQLAQAIADAICLVENETDPTGRYVIRGRGPLAAGDQMGEFYWVAPTDDPEDANRLEWDVIAHVTRPGGDGNPVDVFSLGFAKDFIERNGRVTIPELDPSLYPEED